jgi:hypothetical protein
MQKVPLVGSDSCHGRRIVFVWSHHEKIIAHMSAAQGVEAKSVSVLDIAKSVTSARAQTN